MDGTEELLDRAGVALERDWIFPSWLIHVIVIAKEQERS
jgi:hypothetical protein